MIYKIIEIKAMLNEVMDEESGCNEGSLCMYYNEIIKKLDNIKEKLFLFSEYCFLSESEEEE